VAEAIAGPAWSDVAASAYCAYGASVGNRKLRVDPLFPWADLPEPIRVAWEAAARQVGECLTAGADPAAFPNPDLWAGWKPWIEERIKPMMTTKLYLCSGTGTAKENKNARDHASLPCGLQDLNLVTVSSVLPAGIELIDRDQFLDAVRPGQIVHAIHGICESDVPGQLVNATLCCVIPEDPTLPGYVAELYEHPGLDPGIARKRTELMALQLFAERNGVGPDFDPAAAWEPGRTDYRIGPLRATLRTVQAVGQANEDGDYTAALAAAVLLP
jgi:arginine decarboxylase